jgi:nucleoside diphosphate kinase
MPIERTFALIKTGAIDRHMLARLQAEIATAGITCIRNAPFGEEINPGDRHLFQRLYAGHADRPYYAGLIGSVERVALAMILEGGDVISRWRTLMGPTDPVRARAEQPRSLRARYGGDAMPDNALHGSDSSLSATREIAIFFPDQAIVDG